MNVEPGTVVRLKLVIQNELGVPIQAEFETFDVILGFGQLVPKVESALIGKRVGDKCVLELEPDDAFGPRDESRVVEFDKAEFPDDVSTGDHFEAESEDGASVQLTVLEVSDDFVRVDLNHPLAGQSVRVEFEVYAIRPADPVEVASARRRQGQGEFAPTGGLLPAKSLLNGRERR
jgi:FKBP-type peptidyl-prolyl cis-trans isomerase SlyD